MRAFAVRVVRKVGRVVLRTAQVITTIATGQDGRHLLPPSGSTPPKEYRP